MARAIPEELVPLIEGGVAGWLATASVDRVPETARVRGARVGESRRTVTLFVPTAQAGRTFENLRHVTRVAVFLGRVVDFRAVQIKGEVIGWRPSDAEERQLQERHMRAFVDAVESVGRPAPVLKRHVLWPSAAIEISIEELFEQSPGPGSGRVW